MLAPTRALFRTSWMLDSNESPPVSSVILFKRKGVLSFPLIPNLSISDIALSIDLFISSSFNSYTFGSERCFSVNGTSGGTYYFTSIFTVKDGIPQEKLNYNIIEYENNIFKCIDKFDSDYTYYIFDEETGDFIQTEI